MLVNLLLSRLFTWTRKLRACGCLLKQRCGLRDVAFVKRHGESNFSVGNVTLVAGGKSQLLRAPDSGEPFFSLQQTESNGMTFVRTTLEALRFITTSNWMLQLVQPIMVAMPHVLRAIPEANCNAPETKLSNRCEKNTSFVFPLMDFHVDDLRLHLKQLSLTHIERASGDSRVGLLMKELSVLFGEETDVLSPMKVEMTEEEDILVSAVTLNVSSALWEYLCHVRTESGTMPCYGLVTCQALYQECSQQRVAHR
ncbi:hypothetical protein C3747_137g5 [Trypanosoma cruzi]|uniref:Uncharacterized protein n=1 Tax=Trypanosoma cruzi TaxID=5693 RepID=A0A2V2W976_TRYCR|nr:hypothetical protein C3747_137g5 [Trypanosoma cruzi]